MKIKFITFFSFVIFACTNLYAQTPQSANSQEVTKLNAEVIKLFKEKRFKEAEPIARRVIAMRENESGKTHISVADAWRNLGHIELQLNKNKDAEKAFENAFEIYEKNQPLTTAYEKVFVETLEASAYYDTTDRNFDRAEKKFLRANEFREKTNGKDSLEIANNFMRLGEIYRIKRDYARAAPAFLRSLEIRKQKLKIYDDKVQEAYLETSCIYGKLGRSDELSEINNEIYPTVSDEDAAKRSADVKQIAKGVVNGTAISLPRPAYPSEARGKGASGTVNVRVLIDKTGNVIHACAVDGAKELHAASESAAYSAKFKPTTLSGTPVNVVGNIVYNYVP